MDIYNYQRKYEQAFIRLKKARVSIKNKQLISDFNDTLILEGLSKPRLVKNSALKCGACLRSS